MDLIRYIEANWGVLSKAPLLSAILVIAGATSAWWLRGLIDRKEVAAAHERRSLAEEKNRSREAGNTVPAAVCGGSGLHRGVLHPDAECRLARELTRYKGKAITMRALGNMCAQRCLGELRRVFEAAGWTVTSAPWNIIGELTGVWLSPKSKDNPCAAAEAASAGCFAGAQSGVGYSAPGASGDLRR